MTVVACGRVEVKKTISVDTAVEVLPGRTLTVVTVEYKTVVACGTVKVKLATIVLVSLSSAVSKRTYRVYTSHQQAADRGLNVLFVTSQQQHDSMKCWKGIRKHERA